MLPIRDTIVGRNPPIVTWVLILVNSVVFLFELTMPEPALEQFFYLFGLVPARYTHPTWALWVGLPMNDYWPFLTSMFLHGGWMHIIGNMWTLWIFGDNVEDRMGPMRFLFFYQPAVDPPHRWRLWSHSRRSGRLLLPVPLCAGDCARAGVFLAVLL